MQSRRVSAEMRVVRIASVLRIGTGTLIVIVPIMFLLAIWLLTLAPTASTGPNFFQFIDTTPTGFSLNYNVNEELTSSTKLGLILCITLYALWALYCVLRIHFLLGNFKSKNIFIHDNTILLRNLGFALIAPVAIVIVGQLIYAAFLFSTSQAEALNHLYDINFKLNGRLLTKLLMIGSVFLSAWVIEIGRELYNDSEFTI